MIFFRYHNTSCCFIQSAIDGRLLAFDAGWPNTLHEYARNLKQIGFRFGQIKWAIVSHFHMDHAGLISDFLQNGITCYVFENQMEAIDRMEKIIFKNDKAYTRMDKGRLTRAETHGSASLLGEMGITGEVMITDCHSPDSISILVNNEAAVGDLHPIDQLMPDDKKCLENWDRLHEKGIEMVYPSHAAPFNLNDYYPRGGE